MTHERVLKNLKQARKQRGVSLRALSEITGVSAMYLSLIENGKNVVSVEKLLKI